MLDRVTVTGADDETSINNLVELSKKFPLLEIGVLVSDSNTLQKTGYNPRFPSLDWIKALCEAKAESPEVKLSLHVCGRWVNQLLEDKNTSFYSKLGKYLPSFDRIQLNTHGIETAFSTSAIVALRGIFAAQQIIIQADGTHENLLGTCQSAGVNCAVLFDSSHGEGRLAENWPKEVPGIYCGWAGGLSHINLKENLLKIFAQRLTNAPFWIDAETRLRSNKGGFDYFDLNKVHAFAGIAEDFISEMKPFESVTTFVADTKLTSKCLEKASNDEPIFVLRGQDVSSPKVIFHWIAKNFETLSSEKIIDAVNQALAMRNYGNRRQAD